MKIDSIQIGGTILVCLMLFACQGAQAQSDDFRTRAGIKASHTFTNGLNTSLELQGRLRANSSLFHRALIEPEISYDLPFNFRIGAGWRSELNQSVKRNQSVRHRVSSYARYKFEVGDFEYGLKTQLQYGSDELSFSSFQNNTLTNRNSVEIAYNWFGKKTTPYAEYEFHTHLNNSNGAIINQMRYTMGASYKLRKGRSFDLFYLFEDEMNVVNPVDSHSLGLIFKFKI